MYTAQKPARSNSRKLTVTDEHGKQYTVNRHGVVTSWSADPHFSGWATMDWLEREQEEQILAAVAEQQPQFTPCKCCWSPLHTIHAREKASA